MINSIEGCGKVKGNKNSTLSGIKAAEYVVVNFHKGCFCCMLILYADCIGSYIEYSLMCSSSLFATSFSITFDIK